MRLGQGGCGGLAGCLAAASFARNLRREDGPNVCMFFRKVLSSELHIPMVKGVTELRGVRLTGTFNFMYNPQTTTMYSNHYTTVVVK